MMDFKRIGDVVLFPRPGTPHIQARFRLNGRLYRFSTKTTNMNEAEKIATEKYYKQKFANEEGIYLQSKRFDSAANMVIDKLQKERDNGINDKLNYDKILIIKNYLMEYFKNKDITNINTTQKWNEFCKWRDDKMTERYGNPASDSTAAKHLTAMRDIYDFCMTNGWLAPIQIPKMEPNGNGSKRKATFTKEEIDLILNSAFRYKDGPGWLFKDGKGITAKTIWFRFQLYRVIGILKTTGCRAGTEIWKMKRKHISLKVVNGVQCYYIWIKYGKTAKKKGQDEQGRRIFASLDIDRFLLYSDEMKNGLKKAYQRKKSSGELDNEKAFKILFKNGIFTDQKPDDLIIDIGDSKPKVLNDTFQRVLEELGILYDNDGKARSLYSIRHFVISHTIETEENLDLYDFALHCGTSVEKINRYYRHSVRIHKEKKYIKLPKNTEKNTFTWVNSTGR